jgi:cobaltochelatase CobN
VSELKQTRVTRSDGKTINLVQRRGHLSVCATGCCCGKVERGYAPVPIKRYHEEWLKRKLRRIVHLTKGGCLGPCALANVASLVFDGRAIWFHSIATERQIVAIFDYIEAMVEADAFLPPPASLEGYTFDFYDWRKPSKPESADAPSRSQEGMLLLSHADTDLLTLQSASAQLPDGFPPVHARNLQTIKTEEHMAALLEGDAAAAQVVVIRILGRPGGIPGFGELVKQAETRGKHLIVVSGTGDLNPELTAASTVPPVVVHEAMAYLQAGGQSNMEHLLRFLADHLLMTGFSYDAPTEEPDHGIYHPSLPVRAGISDWYAHRKTDAPTVGILFYRSHWMSGNLDFIDALVEAVELKGANALPIFTSSLRTANEREVGGRRTRWPEAFDFLLDSDGRIMVDSLISTVSFAIGEINSDGPTSSSWSVEALEVLGVPVVQAITSGMNQWQWDASPRGLNPLDTAMNIALPEFDGRLISVPISFKEIPPDASFGGARYAPVPDRVERVVDQVLRLASLRRKENREKRIAFIFTNSASKAAQVGNAVGLDAPASLMQILRAMRAAGYLVEDLPADGDALIHELIARCSYDEIFLTEQQLENAVRVPTARYQRWFDELSEQQREQMLSRWGEAPGEAYLHEGHLALAGLELGNVFVALQPPRGYGMDPDAIYHTPDLPPPHHYYALYRWLRDEWGADALVHVGKHGTLEWLPGKGVGLSRNCFPDSFLADLPLFYPFILNDPGEGTQAKRRAHATVVDHLVPAMTTADVYGDLAQLAQLVDEYYQVEMLDPAKLPLVQQQIWDLIRKTNLGVDLSVMLRRDHGDHVHEWDDELTPEGIPVTLTEMKGSEVAHLIEDIDAYLCDLGAAQIRDGLHTLGQVPQKDQLIGLLQALTRLPNLDVPSLPASVAGLFGLDFDTLLDSKGERLRTVPGGLRRLADRPLVSNADAIETINEISCFLLELLQDHGFDPAQVDGIVFDTFGVAPGDSAAVRRVLSFVCESLLPNIRKTTAEIDHLLHGLGGGYIPAGPSGAPTRGMAHVLPTGRNFYAVDPRALPSVAAWRVGQELAREVLERYLRETGEYPESIGISVWGTSAMRTHGDDIAEILALMGVRPVWQKENRRITGFEVIPLSELGRPRVDVTVRISGFFRDAFPHLIKLLDEAVEAVVTLDEPPDQNFLRKHYLEDVATEIAAGGSQEHATRAARYRVFGSKPGTYGAGILPLIHEQNWSQDADFAEVYVNWGGYAYTAIEEGVDARDTFRQRLASVQVALHNQDNREHDIFDSDDYLQFHGGMIATIRTLAGKQPKHYFGDTHDPARVVVRDLKEEALRVFRTRVVNPKWLESITRHGYKGGLEMAATVDYLFGYDATSNVVDDWMYEQVSQSYALDPGMQDFLRRSNPWALMAISERLLEAAQRGLWADPSKTMLDQLKENYLETEALLESRENSLEGATR